MGDLQPGAGEAGRFDGFVHGFEHVVVLIAHMNGIEGVVLGDNFVELHHLTRVAVAAGGIFQTVGKADGAQTELLVEDSAHLLQVVVGSLHVVGADDGFAHVAVPDQARIIDADLVFGQAFVEAVDVSPGGASVPRPVFVALPGLVGIDERAVTAVAAYFAGDALENTAVALGRVEEIGIRVDVDVDESRRDDQPLRIDDVCSVGSQILADSGDFSATDGDVALDGRLAVAGMDDAVLDEGVESGALRGDLATGQAREAECGCAQCRCLEEISSVHIIRCFAFSSNSPSSRPVRRRAGLRVPGGRPGTAGRGPVR